MKLIENPIVFTGSTNIRYNNDLVIPPNTEFNDHLFYEQITRNIVRNSTVTMKRVSSQELISQCKPKIWSIKYEAKESTNIIDVHKGTLSPNQYRRMVHAQDISRSMQEIRCELRSNPTTHITTELSNVCGHVSRDIENESKDEIIANFKDHFYLNGEDIKCLRKQISHNKKLTIKNYPHLSYAIYNYFLIHYMCSGRQQNADHLDKSFFLDFQYLHYLNFCDRFIANETSTPHIVKAIPYSEISNKPIMTSEELVKELD